MTGDLMDRVFGDIKTKKSEALRNETLSNQTLSEETLSLKALDLKLLEEAIEASE